VLLESTYHFGMIRGFILHHFSSMMVVFQIGETLLISLYSLIQGD